MTISEPRPIVVWSSDWTEITGQAIVTRRVIEHQPDINWIQASYGRGGLRSSLGWIGAIARIYFAVLTGKAQTVYLVCSRSKLGFLRDVPALVLGFIRIRVVVHAHGSDIVDLLSDSPLAPFARLLYNRCELLVPSKHLIAPLETLCRCQLHLCENYVLQSSVDRSTADMNGRAPLVVWNSNIMASKGFFEVAKAVRLARTENPNLRLVAMGRPLRDAEMTAEAAQNALNALCREDWFTYLGSVSAERAFRWTAHADVVAFPSRYSSECQPLAVIQAMCLGRPLILNDIPALRATLGDYPAVFLPEPNAANLASEISAALASGSSPALAGAALAARQRFSPERFDQDIATILLKSAS